LLIVVDCCCGFTKTDIICILNFYIVSIHAVEEHSARIVCALTKYLSHSNISSPMARYALLLQKMVSTCLLLQHLVWCPSNGDGSHDCCFFKTIIDIIHRSIAMTGTTACEQSADYIFSFSSPSLFSLLHRSFLDFTKNVGKFQIRSETIAQCQCQTRDQNASTWLQHH
jgi:hypothetical protein